MVIVVSTALLRWRHRAQPLQREDMQRCATVQALVDAHMHQLAGFSQRPTVVRSTRSFLATSA